MKSALKIVQKYYPEVTKVIEAKKDATIEVTEADCKGARKKSPNSCALARAYSREYDGAIVSLSTAYLIKDGVATRYQVPQAISRELVSFDRHHDFAPGEYKLKRPSKSFKLRPRGDRPLKPERHNTTYQQNKPRNHKTAGIRAL